MAISHVVVLMLENRSFDCMLGTLYPASDHFDGLTLNETNPLHTADGGTQTIRIWNSDALTAEAVCVPDPDPGELFTDIHMQIHGISNIPGQNGPTMSGFVDNYMRQPKTTPAPDPAAVMHYFTSQQMPVLNTLAKAFAVSDRWFASAPCQTWPNRFFAHCCTAGGYVNNEPIHAPFDMPTVFNRIDDLNNPAIDWRIYHHDIPQSATLSRLWEDAFTHFKPFSEFLTDAAQDTLPSYSFIEPRYFPDLTQTLLANDAHPPHNVAYAEQLIAQVYNALRAGPGWTETLFIITCDEHGGCFDHVKPPPAVSPDTNYPDGFDFGYYGVRVPAVIISPYIKAGSVMRPTGNWPFDHTSISATLHALFGTAFLTERDKVAPHLLSTLTDKPDNMGPAQIVAPPVPAPSTAQVAASAAKPPNDLQASLAALAALLPTGTANVGAHIARIAAAPPQPPVHVTTAGAANSVQAGMQAFLTIPAHSAG
jgi:phospholipase C